MSKRLTALAAFLLLATPFTGAAKSQPDPIDHSNWDALLRDYVNAESRVDYQRLAEKGLSEFDAYVAAIAEADTAELTADQSKAFLINAYNALTVRWILRHYPVPSIWSTPDPFKEVRHTVGGEQLSLDQIESRLRETGDARIHAALVCAARSCPPLRREAYVASRISEQLDDNTRRWLANPELNRFDAAKGEARVSSILKWYREDFESSPGGLEAFVKRYAPEEVRQQLGDRKLKVKFLDYHWGLNDQSELGANYSRVRLGFDWLKNVFR